MNDTTKQHNQRFEVQHGLRGLHFIQDWQTDNVYDVLMEHGANRNPRRKEPRPTFTYSTP